MNDYSTDEEELQKLKNWWNDNKLFIVSGLIAGGSLLFGYNWYKDMKRAEAETASAMFAKMQESVIADDRAAAIQTAELLRKDYSSTPYDHHAELALAKLHVEAGDVDAAMAALKNVVNTGEEELAHVARLRLARLQLASGLSDEAQKSLSVADEAGFTSLYQEVRGDILLAKGDSQGAIEQYKLALSHDVPLGDVQFIEMKLHSLGATKD